MTDFEDLYKKDDKISLTLDSKLPKLNTKFDIIT